jgi:hypothetical protein
VPDPAQGDRGGKWIPVGNSATCAFATANEDRDACSLKKVGSANAENPNVTAGSLDPAKPTVPWVAWHEEATPGGSNLIFVSRLVNGDHFEVFPGPNVDGSLNASPAQDADEPDLRLEGNVLHVTWKEVVTGGKVHEFERRFTPGPGGTGSWSTAVDIQVDSSLDGGTRPSARSAARPSSPGRRARPRSRPATRSSAAWCSGTTRPRSHPRPEGPSSTGHPRR